MKTYHIVWNESRTEGYITDDADDATLAATGFQAVPAVSTLALAMREQYADGEDDQDTELPMQTIQLP